MADEAERAAMILGMAASPGIARGVAFVCPCSEHITVPRRTIAESELPQETAKLEAALFEAEKELLALQAEVQEKIGESEAAMFEAQALLLRDPTLRNEIMGRCQKEQINVEAALSDTAEKLNTAFSSIEDPFFRERAADFRDLARRLLNILLKREGVGGFDPPEGSIVVVGELLPTITAKLDQRRVHGLIAEKGGPTAHAVILARSLGIPTVIYAENATTKIRPNDQLIVDGLAGRVFINPSESINREYDRLEADLAAHKTALKDLIDLPAVTQDGVVITLKSNIGKVADAAAAAAFKADGIGLYRTEFVFLVQDHFPSEEEQYQIYRATADKIAPGEVVIRALDVGSDKLLSYFPLSPEANPSLGRRGTRLLLGHPEILRTQLRAILRLSATHPVAILFPMIGDAEEMIEARKAVQCVQAELHAEQQLFNPQIRVGAMIETPAAAMTARWIAREADFLSIGTNDLVQYLLASDRTSREMSAYYEPLHPAVIQSLASIVHAASAEGKEVSICGEMAGNPAFIELLLGLGLRSLSVAPGELLEIKRVIHSLSLGRAEELAGRVLASGLVREVKEHLAVSARGSTLPALTSPLI